MSPPRAAKTPTNRPVPGAFSCDALANRHPRPKNECVLARAAEIRDLWFSGA